MFTIKRAAELTGIPAATLRVWERRYGLGAPHRTPAGYRVYDTQSIARLKAMQRKVEQGTSPQQAAAEVLASGLPGTAEPAVGDADALTTRFLAAATALDTAELTHVLDSAFSTASFEHVVDTWLGPTMAAMGEMWTRGEADIAAEHFASHAIMRKLSAAFEAAGNSPTGPAVVVGTPSGSMHQIGALAFATALRRQGTRTIFLGADVPVETWAATASRPTTGAVALSVTTDDDLPMAQACVDAVRATGLAVPIVVGGPASHGVSGADLVLPAGISASARVVADLVS